ncbi:KipI family sensor histidine kinase inhibitor [Angulomicrobium tetraedrale]|uniref:KipI family sensor histidine kinase inhibitor n=1 Tax=Ancylobacter tetraedralis TaxID=217068 RepID=A0A839ZFQ3_9HYPH|nr:5-oxoprolinase subunit PxpB [Ancylobacter tetraedralis]MBB3773629.1 KipI family sensor histidine kinase inhibitor [Ancylobacter tetraedralis]
MKTAQALPPRLLDAGESGLVVEFGDAIDEQVNREVIALADALDALPLAGIREVVPTYRSLLVLFDPLVLSRETLRARVLALWPPRADGRQSHGTRHGIWHVPVAYGGEHGVDLDHVARLHGLSTREVVDLHSGAEYRVYMIGFAPGFAYLGGLNEAIHTSRRTDPRLKTPPRSVSIGGRQAAVSPPLEIPSGWHLLGQTPVRSYDPARAERPFLFAAGDTIRFTPIPHAEYAALCRAAEAGEIVAEWEPA